MLQASRVIRTYKFLPMSVERRGCISSTQGKDWLGNLSKLGRRAFLVGASAVLGANVAACAPEYRVRFKVTHRFIVDGVLREIAAVREFVSGSNPEWSLSPIRLRGSMKGEAAVGDFGRGRVLFSLIGSADRGPDGRYIRQGLIRPDVVLIGRGAQSYWTEDNHNPFLEQLERNSFPRTRLRSHELPMIAMFGNLLDKGTAAFVPYDQIETMFPSVKHHSCFIEPTKERLIGGLVKKYIPWIVDQPMILNNIANNIGNPYALDAEDFMMP